jgi:hypothetical protein
MKSDNGGRGSDNNNILHSNNPPPRVKSEMLGRGVISAAATRATAVRKKGDSSLAPPTQAQLEKEIRGVWTRSWQVGLLGRVVSHWEDVFTASSNHDGVPSGGGGFVWSVAPLLEEAVRVKQQQHEEDIAADEEEAALLSKAATRAGVKRERSGGNNYTINNLVEIPQPPSRRAGNASAAASATTASPFGFDDRLVYHEF